MYLHIANHMNLEAASMARPAPVVSVLIVLGSETSMLLNILRHSNWDVAAPSGFEEPAARLQNSEPAVVVAPFRPDGTLGWTTLLDMLNTRHPRPRLVVTDRHIDHSKWAEALNLGACDVLVQPLDVREVFRVLTSAWHAWWYDGGRIRAASTTPTHSHIARGQGCKPSLTVKSSVPARGHARR